MGLDVSVDEAAGVVHVRWSGTVTFVVFQSARAEVMAAPRWSPKFAHLLDFTGITALELSHQEVQMLADAKPIFSADSLQILIASSGSVSFGLSRMFGAYATGKRNVHVVESVEQALGLVSSARRQT